MTRKAIRRGLWAAVAAVSLWVTTDTRAADVNALAATCANCHGKDGASTGASVPIISGLSAPYLVDNLTAYKTKERPCPPTEVRAGDKKGAKTDMCAVVKDLSDADIKQVAGYFAGQKFAPATQTVDAELARKGAQLHQQNCEKCHSKNGSLADDDSGILAGQWMPYLKEQMVAFSSGARKADPKMKPVIQNLDKANFDALANYYGSVK